MQRLRHHYLLPAAILLLVFTNACSKKDGPSAKMESTGSYILDGQTKNCLITQTASTTASANRDDLTISLTTNPQPSSGPEVLEIKFWKRIGQPISDYDYVYDYSSGGMVYNTNKMLYIGYFFTIDTKAISSTGVLSGNFAGEARVFSGPMTYTVTHTISAGTFDNVQL